MRSAAASGRQRTQALDMLTELAASINAAPQAGHALALLDAIGHGVASLPDTVRSSVHDMTLASLDSEGARGRYMAAYWSTRRQ